MIYLSLSTGSWANLKSIGFWFALLQIVIVTDEEEERKFKEEIGVDALPEEYGGQAKLTLIQDVLPQTST